VAAAADGGGLEGGGANAGAVSGTAADGDPIDVGRQLFVDSFLIEHTTLVRRFHRCELYAQNPVLRPDRRWEMIFPTKTAMAFSDGCFFDPRDKKFKLWYMAAWFGDTAYAVSEDGWNWTKPALDVRPTTNIVLLAGQR